MKHCNGCKQEKPYSEFHKRSNTKSGYQARCKPCHRKLRLDKKAREDRSRDKKLKYEKKPTYTPYILRKNGELEEYLREQYRDFTSEGLPVIASILNAVVAQKLSHFRLSRRILRDLIQNDPNVLKDNRKLGDDDLKKIKGVIHEQGLFYCIQDHDSKNASVWEVTDPVIVEYLREECVDFDTQREATLVKKEQKLVAIDGGKTEEKQKPKPGIGARFLKEIILDEKYERLAGYNLNLNGMGEPRDWNAFKNLILSDFDIPDLDERIAKAFEAAKKFRLFLS